LHLQSLREEENDRLVCPAALGRGGDAHLPAVAVTADDRGPCGAGRDDHAEASHLPTKVKP
jgi:hypothetical protein